MADYFASLYDESNPYISQGLKRRRTEAARPVQTTVESTDPYKGDWGAEATRSVLANRANEVTNLLPAAFYGVTGNDEARLAAAGRYQDQAKQNRALGPDIQSIDDAAAKGGGVGNYGAALAYMAADTAPDLIAGGAGGFFGIGVAHRPFASDVVESRLPGLLQPQLQSCAGAADMTTERRDHAARINRRVTRAWGRFKLAAISSFAFVEAAGPLHVGKLLRDGLGLAKASKTAEPAPRFDPGLELDTRVGIAEGALRAMSLTLGFARVVVLAGHGADVVNNPHASGLQCGACGGHAGDVNARLMASLLNDADVRARLGERGIVIPTDTLFVAALHHTTTDLVTLYDADHPSTSHAQDLLQVRRWLAAAGSQVRGARMLRLPRAGKAADVLRRASDWSEVRPEWALAGCQSFVIAPRLCTRSLDLGGRAFLHDYDWRQDEDFGLLEMILTAPVVVASWISLQYYGSSVAPALLGAGNKLLHNVTGGIGVVEGNGGLLRAGLPWQSVHDGERLMHQPLRLSVLVAAPREAIDANLGRHDSLRSLFEHRWMHLFALDEQGRMTWRYAGDFRWERFGEHETGCALEVAIA